MDISTIIEYTPVLAAFLLGLATAVSPCTLAANISGIAYISRSLSQPRYTLLVGILLSIGRIVTFILMGAVMIAAGRTLGHVALFSQNVGTIALGILLVIIGIFLLDIIHINIDIGGGMLAGLMEKTHTLGLIGAFFLGLLYGCAFCPYSAALFFGILIPLAIRTSQGYVLPLFFGMGVNIPVLVFTAFLVIGVKRARHIMGEISQSWTVISRVLGIFLISISFYYLYPHISLYTGKSLSWLPYIVAGILLLMLVVHEVMKKQTSSDLSEEE